MAGTPKKRKSLEILAKQDPHEIIERHAKGESIASLQKNLGVTVQAWYQWVNSQEGLSEKLREVREKRAEDMPWEAIEIIDAADPKEITKAREQVKARQWYAERVAAQFKPKQEISVGGSIIHQHLQALKASQEVMEAEIIPDTPTPKQLGTNSAGDPLHVDSTEDSTSHTAQGDATDGTEDGG